MYDNDFITDSPAEAVDIKAGPAIDRQQLLEFTKVLEKYSSGRHATAARIQSAEQWWKLHNTQEEAKTTGHGKDGGFTSKSAWLHNVITSKHADAMDAYPEPQFLPREESDEHEARMLDAIVPCILEQNGFEQTYSDAMWQKCKTGTGAYKIVWDPYKLNGLGDISITCVNLLNLYWQPEIRDIQKSRYFFHVELADRDLLEQEYPQIKDRAKGRPFVQAKFQNDEQDVDDPNRVTVIEVYYHKRVNGKRTLQYCKYAGDVVLYATENMTEPELNELGEVVKEPMAVTGLYDHGLYPYVFDALFPVEGSPCGYGFVDICRNPQTVVDLLKTSMVKNGMVGATPRYFSCVDGTVKEEDFLDLSKPIVHVNGNLDDTSLRPVDYVPLPGIYLNVAQDTVQELRETSGNTETSTGNTNSGVTAAAAIAALQRASGKGSRDAARASYRRFAEIINMTVCLIRQFYDLPRKFRILGEGGAEEYVTYSNQGLAQQDLVGADGQAIGSRLPVFDIKVEPQTKNAYTAMAQNELAIQLYQLGIFNPQMAEQAIICLEMMDFEGKDKLIRKISENALIKDKLFNYLQLVLSMPDPMLQAQAATDLQQIFGVELPPAGQPAPVGKLSNQEPAGTQRARQESAQAALPR